MVIVLPIESVNAHLHLPSNELHKTSNLWVHASVSVDNSHLLLDILEGNTEKHADLGKKFADFVENVFDLGEGHVSIGGEIVVGSL